MDKRNVRLTIFTPTFNRIDTLKRTFNSLCNQTNKSFIWLIVDDGSTDSTKDVVTEWINKDNGFKIRYIYKTNGGMHTAHNTAYENIDTELNTCIDSDDYMPMDAVDKILSFWDKYGSDKYAGMAGLDQNEDGTIIGTAFDRKETTLSGFYARGGKGDKKLVYRTEVMKKYPKYPEFENEKLVPLSYKYILCDQDYTLLTLNEPLVVVEYLESGSSKNIFKQYIKSPRGFAEYRKVSMVYQQKFLKRFTECIHYVSSCKFYGEKHIIRYSPKKFMTMLAYIPGIMLNRLILRKQESHTNIER